MPRTPKKMLSPHFSENEFRCKCGCGIVLVSKNLLGALERMRKMMGPITIKSGCRCPTWNKVVGGKRRSAHITTEDKECLAADIGLRSKGSRMRLKVVKAALEVGIKRIGPHKGFVHIDVATHLPEGMWVY
jgi:uncharacterized protein YcbK (DUF882 family)